MQSNADKIEITGANLVAVVKKAYELSEPRGMGFLQYQPGPLDDRIAREIVQTGTSNRFGIAMDYVLGRVVKLAIRIDADGRAWLSKDWFDHTPTQLQALVEVALATIPAKAEG